MSGQKRDFTALDASVGSRNDKRGRMGQGKGMEHSPRRAVEGESKVPNRTDCVEKRCQALQEEVIRCVSVTAHSESAATVGNVRNKAYWLGLAPLLHCCDESTWRESHTAAHPAAKNQEQVSDMRARLLTDGYCKFDGPGPDESEVECMVGRVADAMGSLVHNGWHPLWILCYDEPWLLFGRLRALLGAVANPSGEEEFGLNWDWMAYHLDPGKEP